MTVTLLCEARHSAISIRHFASTLHSGRFSLFAIRLSLAIRASVPTTVIPTEGFSPSGGTCFSAVGHQPKLLPGSGVCQKRAWQPVIIYVHIVHIFRTCLLYTSPSPRDGLLSR